MAVIQARSIDAFVRKPDAHFALVLVYGPDTGLVNERVRALIAASVDDAADPFQMVKLDGDDLAADPGRLSDEANTVPLFGGRRAIWVRAGAKSLLPALAPLLAAPPRDCRIVIEGGDWRRSHQTVAAVERSRAGAVLPSYADEASGLDQIIAEEVAAAGLTIAPEARQMLIGLLGGDRLASRAEIRKLTLYAAGAGRIELSDVEAIVGDASLLATDEIVDAAFSGNAARLDSALAKAWSEGVNASVLAGAALRHALLLHRLRAQVDLGRPAAAVVDAAGGQIHYKRKASVAGQLATGSSERLETTLSDLSDTVLDARRNPALAEAIVSRMLMRIALAARR
jgi:DNA polymerase III subunit delta